MKDPAMAREYARVYRAKNLEKCRADVRAWHSLPENKARMLLWRKEHSQTPEARKKTQEYCRSRRLGMDAAAWERAREHSRKGYQRRRSDPVRWAAYLARENARRRKDKNRRLEQANYRAKKKRATPPWADRGAVSRVYAEARKRTLSTGAVWHVDHIIPLSHPRICGLHVDYNLQVIPASENYRKSNKLGVAIFSACEIKASTTKTTDEQNAFVDAVQSAGGIGMIVRSEADAIKGIDDYRGGRKWQ